MKASFKNKNMRLNGSLYLLKSFMQNLHTSIHVSTGPDTPNQSNNLYIQTAFQSQPL